MANLNKSAATHNAMGRTVGFMSGLLMGLGIAIGGMADPTRSLSFFCPPFLAGIRSLFPNAYAPRLPFDPTMGVVFACALATNFVLYRIIMSSMKKPVLGGNFSIPTYTDITPNLVLGASLFGIGWALAGFCPGPGVIAIVTGRPSALLFTLGMFGAWAIYKRSQGNKLSIVYRSAELRVAFAIIFGSAVFLYAMRGDSTYLNHFRTWQPIVPSLTPVTQQIAGGLMIGSSIALLMGLTGKILGISGILSGIVNPYSDDRVCRLVFFGGLVASGEVLYRVYPYALANDLNRPLWCFLLGGALVGLGTSLANGCTSGHGICGNTRLSKRSMVATATFMAFNGLAGAVLISFGF